MNAMFLNSNREMINLNYLINHMLISDIQDISDIQNYFKCIIIKHETLTDNLPAGIYVIKIANRITFK